MRRLVPEVARGSLFVSYYGVNRWNWSGAVQAAARRATA